MAADQNAPKNPFQDTLNLPKTEFPIRAHAQQKEPEILKRWEESDLYTQASIKNKGGKRFVLHDGPPFANGHLHMGHALSYILKDIVCKAKRMEGYHVNLLPGWDCHGLPIELKVTTEKGIEKDRSSMDRVTFKKYCREFAQQWIAIQDKELKELGKLADYKHAYLTMNPGYEASILRAFATFVEKGYIERKLKTVPWCASCQTVLATAEIEYKDRSDPSLYVLFPLPDQTAQAIFPWLFEKNPKLSLHLAVWTTTPWTLPLNRAVVLNPSAVYQVVQGRTPDEAFIVAKERAQAVCSDVGLPHIELAECDSVVFENRTVQHPFITDFLVPVLLDEMVQIADGTACLHSAPGCGPEDYLLGVKNGLDIFSPLSPDGRYTKGIQPETLEGMSIAEAQGAVIEILKNNNHLLFKGSIKHSYPHCWRCRKGLMFRATNQWFCDLNRHDLIQRALDAIEKITFVPERGKARLHSFISSRSEWCISRQRQWGVPITALICNQCGWSLLNADMIRAVADRVAKEGIEFWDRMTPALLEKENIISGPCTCQVCGNNNPEQFSLERDILDVWFDSGTSSYAVLVNGEVDLGGVPADAYFEGSDQHRGWFQSSLLCGMVLYDHAPMKTIITHGFIIDEHKRKMSKSLGNGIAPDEVMTKFSRDILRLWVAGADFEDDMVMSEKLLVNVSEMYRKIRNTLRFLIANIYDFDITTDAVEVVDMCALDQYALARLHDLSVNVRQAYDAYHFSAVVQSINEYCTNDLSAVYLDILKDRLYVEKPTSQIRRSAQTVLYHILDVLTHLLAPTLSFLAEETSDYYQKGKTESIHLQDFPAVLDVWSHLATTMVKEYPLHQSGPQARESADFVVAKQGQWVMLEMLRTAVLKAIEVRREQGTIKHSYESHVTIWLDPTSKEYELFNVLRQELHQRNEDVLRFLKDWFIVSTVTLVTEPGSLDSSLVEWARVAVEHAHGTKCPRCWRWDLTQHADNLCMRCHSVVGD